MNSLLDDDYDEPSGNDRELTLSTGTILGIFLGLAVLCGLFFGFGYKMGSRKATPTLAAAAPETPSAPTANFSSFKPAAGEPANSSPTPSAPLPTPPSYPVSDADSTPTSSPAPVVRATAPVAPAAVPAPGTNGIFVVQVAAVSRQEDAELLVHALNVKGYPAFERNEPQDKLLHIQVGPYTTRKDADAARVRLLSDGYQPIIK